VHTLTIEYCVYKLGDVGTSAKSGEGGGKGCCRRRCRHVSEGCGIQMWRDVKKGEITCEAQSVVYKSVM
jgi:hypothetical protein